MIKKIFSFLIVIPFCLFLSCESSSGIGGGLLRAAGGIVVGAVDAMVGQYDQQTQDNWNYIKQNSNIFPSYSSDAGYKAMNGDWVGAAVSLASTGAEIAGVNPDLVQLGNSGLNNWIDGNKNSALIDAAQMVTHVSGNYQFDYFFDSQREINRINSEYRENIQNGMSKDVADKIRVEGLANTAADIMIYINDLAAEKKARVAARKREVEDALIQRGYSPMEADVMSAYLSVEAINNDDNNQQWSSIDEMLNYHQVDYKSNNENNVFFDPEVIIPEKPQKDSVFEQPKPVVNTYQVEVDEINKTAVSQYKYLGHKLTDEQKSELDKIVSFMNKWPNAKVTIVGHTCSIGKHEDNLRLGLRRAHQAKLYLIEQGIDEGRISEESMAAEFPCANNDTEEGRLQNRRITFVIN